MKQSGQADLALMGGKVPAWLFNRMKQLAPAIVEAIILDQGKKGFLSRMSNPFWFQSFGSVIGMDWNSSGVTTIVTQALKQSLNPRAKELGLYVCGGKGKASTQTPIELDKIGNKIGLDANRLIKSSKLSAKVDNTAVQDGFQLYHHSFVLSDEGDWSVIQQGMKPSEQSARRYHWHSADIQSFIKNPHSAICGNNLGEILNLVDDKAEAAQNSILQITKEKPVHILNEIPKMKLPKYKGVKEADVNLKRLGSILWLAQESQTTNFEELLLLKGLGPRTLQSLALVSEVIYGTPVRFTDPARYTFAHGSKGGHPIPVPTKVYDETISTLTKAVESAKIGFTDKQKAIAKLSKMAKNAEKNFTTQPNLKKLIQHEKDNAYKYGGRTMKGFSKPPNKSKQLRLFK